ncbi:protein of unknown function [Candidatus Nitrospira inopinata]|uniref:Uncharacterized protein n=1 Tax=Candidatus Nitrospira inopinata TaxID=1715989 RepID=A0A0S4KU27_9BACT|nr:protein of unknown function [Candidatus Nitrospira inopinata]
MVSILARPFERALRQRELIMALLYG